MSAATSRWGRLAVLWSLACAGLAGWWLVDPSADPLPAADDPVSLLGYLQPRTGAALCLAFGLAALLVSVRLSRTDDVPASRGTLVAGATVAAFFGVVAPDVQLLGVLGYLIALLGGPVLVLLLVAGTRRRRANLVVLAVIVLAVLAGVAAGEIGSPTLELLRSVRDGFAGVGPRPLVVAFLAAGGLIVAVTTVLAAQTRTAAASGQRLARWGGVATMVAALGPVPYGLVRMTWLTPWPQGLGPGGDQILEGGIRVFGVCLGLSALAGAWLTVGLSRPWGEVWPAWLPGLRGRPVPLAAAVVPAGIVAVALCGAAISLVVMAVRESSPGLALLIPAPVWGPALLLATYAYWRRRTDADVESYVVPLR